MDKTQGFKSATNKITRLSDLYKGLDAINNVSFIAHFDPFNYGRDLCGFAFPPLSDDRYELSNLLSYAGIRNQMVGDYYIFIRSGYEDIARKVFANYERGAVPSVALEQEWLAKLQTARQ